MTNKKIKTTENPNRNLIVSFRVFQAIFFGILALGISSMAGDISGALEIPISMFSISSTVFGLLGSIISGFLANKSKDW